MKTRNILWVLMGLLGPAVYCWAGPENPNVGNPLTTNRNTVPSANQPRRMINQPNTSNSDYFRGVAPYGVRRYDTFSSPSISSLERRTGSVFVDRTPDVFRSNYNVRRSISPYPSRLESSFNQSRSNLSSPGVTSPYVVPNLPQLKNTQFSRRPLAADTQELDAMLAKKAKLQDEALLKDNTNKKDISKNPDLYDTLTPEQIRKLIDQQQQQQPKTDTKKTQPPRPEEKILAEFMKEQQEALKKKAADTADNEDQAQDNKSDSKSDSKPDSSGIDEEALSQANIAEGRKILGEHKTFKALAESKVAMYLKAGEGFLKAGQYYKAADTYSLAAVWKPDDGRIYLGQALALFAAGEYMSSAYYLDRAFELDGTLAKLKYDLPGIVGDRDTYENRIVEITDWQQRSGSGELAFLMAYVFYQDDKNQQAAASIKTAFEAMPKSPGVLVLKNIIAPQTPAK